MKFSERAALLRILCATFPINNGNTYEDNVIEVEAIINGIFKEYSIPLKVRYGSYLDPVTLTKDGGNEE